MREKRSPRRRSDAGRDATDPLPSTRSEGRPLGSSSILAIRPVSRRRPTSYALCKHRPSSPPPLSPRRIHLRPDAIGRGTQMAEGIPHGNAAKTRFFSLLRGVNRINLPTISQILRQITRFDVDVYTQRKLFATQRRKQRWAINGRLSPSGVNNFFK